MSDSWYDHFMFRPDPAELPATSAVLAVDACRHTDVHAALVCRAAGRVLLLVTDDPAGVDAAVAAEVPRPWPADVWLMSSTPTAHLFVSAAAAAVRSTSAARAGRAGLLIRAGKARGGWPQPDLDLLSILADACRAARSDGECHWPPCPQVRDHEPDWSGRSCPIRQPVSYEEGERPPPPIGWVVIDGPTAEPWVLRAVTACRAIGIPFWASWAGWRPDRPLLDISKDS